MSDVHKAIEVIDLDLIQSQGTGVVLTDAYFLRQVVDGICQLERENQQLRNELASEHTSRLHHDEVAKGLTEENDQLRDGLKVCAEALQHQDRYWHNYTPHLIANSTLHLQIIEKALSHPAVQGLKTP